MNEQPTERDHLALLAEAVNASDGLTATVRQGQNGRPCLNVVNVNHPIMSEVITIENGRFAYPWGHSISAVREIPEAVASLVRVVGDSHP